MRRERDLLEDAVAACEKIERLVGPHSKASFLADEALPAATLHHLTVVGESMARLSPELRGRHPSIRWVQIIAVRHRIVHAYFDLDWSILWDAATIDVPQLRKQLLHVISEEFPT